MRYKESLITDIVNSGEINTLISRYVELKPNGSNYKGLCPFHGEKTPSFHVSMDKQLYHCFGCGAGGNIITFVKEKENLDTKDAIDFLCDFLRIDKSEYIISGSNENYSTSKKERDFYYNINKGAAIFFYENLKKSKKAMEYLDTRNISESTLKKFGLGYANDNWNDLEKYFTKKGYKKLDLINSGLLVNKESKVYDKYRDRIIFPIFTTTNKIAGFGGRVLSNDGIPKYLNSPQSDIFNKSELLYGLNFAKNEKLSKDYIIVVEGYFDVIALYDKNIKNVVAPLGTALTQEHIKVLKRYTKEIVLSFDADKAGKEAAYRSSNILLKNDFAGRVLRISSCKDPDEFIQKHGKDKYIDEINSSLSVIEYLISGKKALYDLSKIESVRNYIKECYDILKNVNSKLVRDMYVTKIAKECSISNDKIKKIFKNINSTNSNYDNKTPKKIEYKNNLLYIVKFILQKDSNVELIFKNINVFKNEKDIFNFLNILKDYDYKKENFIDYYTKHENSDLVLLKKASEQKEVSTLEIKGIIKKYKHDNLSIESKMLKGKLKNEKDSKKQAFIVNRLKEIIIEQKSLLEE